MPNLYEREEQVIDATRIPFVLAHLEAIANWVEDVGRKNLDGFFASIFRTLSQGGLLLSESGKRVALGFYFTSMAAALDSGSLSAH